MYISAIQPLIKTQAIPCCHRDLIKSAAKNTRSFIHHHSLAIHQSRLNKPSTSVMAKKIPIILQTWRKSVRIIHITDIRLLVPWSRNNLSGRREKNEPKHKDPRLAIALIDRASSDGCQRVKEFNIRFFYNFFLLLVVES